MLESDLIEKAGLTPGEAKVYLALLELGNSTTGPITEESGVSRSIIQKILDGLIKKGLVSFVLQDEVKHYQAAQPSRLVDYMITKQQELEAQTAEIETLLPQLLLRQQEQPQSEVAMFQGFKGVQTCFEKYTQKLKKGDEYLCLGIPTQQTETYHAYWNRHHKERIEKNITCRMLFNKGTSREVMKNRNSFAGCDTRIMPTNMKTPAWFYIYADVVAIFLQEQNFAIEITNEKIAQTFRQYFNEFWKDTVKFK